jgi:hypothetical protein
MIGGGSQQVMIRKKTSHQISLAYYCVAFFDLLGQQDRLRTLRSLPNPDDPGDVDLVRQILRDTYGAVMAMRVFFSDSFKAYARAREKIDTRGLSTEQRKMFAQLTNNPIKFQRFSDSIVVYLSLKITEKARLPLRGIFGMLGAAATTFIGCLALDHPIRGSIDVGIGMEPNGTEIYGPALSRAYSLESRIANYPRIVVGDELADISKPCGMPLLWTHSRRYRSKPRYSV